MKKIFLLILIINLSFQANAQKYMSSRDSINYFYKDLIQTFKNGYLHKNNIEWEQVEKETKQNLNNYSTFVNSLNEIEILFDKVGANHCTVYYKNHTYSGTRKNITEKLSDQWMAKYTSNPGFETKVINDEFGYILMPSIMFSNLSEKSIHKISQPFYDKISDLKSKYNPKGWIIDLRFNTGGNMWPMILALYDFLGDNVIAGFMNAEKVQIYKIKLRNGAFYNNSKKISYINPKGNLLDNIKVAIIIGSATASSGEVVALSFKGRKNTIFIGQETYGATTGNIVVPLPFQASMTLTGSYDCDRNGNYYESIVPDISTYKEDNFKDLMLDRNISEAINYFRTP